MPFTSPWAAFGRGMHDALKEQRELQRQAMLDALHKQQVEAGIENQREGTKSLALQREMLAKLNEERLNDIKLKRLRMGQPLEGSTLEDVQKIDPTLIEEKPPYPDMGVSTTTQGPLPGLGQNASDEGLGPGSKWLQTGDIMAPVPPEALQPSPTKVFAGLEEDRDKKRKQDLFTRIQQNPEWFQKLPPIVQEMLFREATGAMPNASAFPKAQVPAMAIGPDGKAVPITGPDGKPVMVPEGTMPRNLPRPPVGRAPQRDDWDTFEHVDPETGKTHLDRINRHDPTAPPIHMDPALRRPASPSSKPQPAFVVPPPIMSNFRQVVTAYNKSLTSSDANVKKGARDNLFASQAQMISLIDDPSLQNFAFTMLTPNGQTVAKKKSLQDIIVGAAQQYTNETGQAPSPDKLERLRMILSTILGKGQ